MHQNSALNPPLISEDLFSLRCWGAHEQVGRGRAGEHCQDDQDSQGAQKDQVQDWFKNIDTSTVKSDAESEDENDMEEVQSNIDAKFPEEVATDDPSVPIDGKLVDKFHIEKPLPKAP